MACRKNAYRALTEVSEWNEKQQEKLEERLAQESQELKQLWTPSHVFENCCSQWLKHGPEVLGHGNQRLSQRGCNGGCGEDHPRITLSYEHESTGVVAALSHPLDPFLTFFEDLVQRNLARRVNSNTSYHIKGFLSDYRKGMEQIGGSHLVKVSPKALAASRRAQERQLEHQEYLQNMKRRKIQGPTADSHLMRQVLDVCYQHNSLQDHLDLAEISWMRTSSKLFAKYAARVAYSRLKKVRISYSILGKNMGSTHASRNEQEHEGDVVSLRFQHGLRQCCRVIASRLAMNANETPGRFVPNENKSFELSNLYSLIIRVYLEDSTTENDCPASCLPENQCLLSGPLEVGRLRVGTSGINCEGVYRPGNFTYELTSLNHDAYSNVISGRLCLQAFHFDFRDLLGVYVRRKLPLAKQNLLDTQEKRPVTLKEKAYVKAIAKAARNSPGDSQVFSGYFGW